MVREADTEDKNEIRAIVDSALDIIRQLGVRVDLPIGQEMDLKVTFQVHQQLYTKNQAKLAALVLDGAESSECTLPVDHE